MSIFAKKLKTLRTEQNLKQEDLAKHLGVNQRTISNWENAVREPDFKTLTQIATYFKVSTDYLLGLED